MSADPLLAVCECGHRAGNHVAAAERGGPLRGCLVGVLLPGEGTRQCACEKFVAASEPPTLASPKASRGPFGLHEPSVSDCADVVAARDHVLSLLADFLTIYRLEERRAWEAAERTAFWDRISKAYDAYQALARAHEVDS